MAVGSRRERGDPGSPLDLTALQATAEAEGRRCVVGALILDQPGHRRVFVHRRGYERRFLPGCWDIVGGHVEVGETLLEALEREVYEETGWRVARASALAYVADWETGGGEEEVVRRREFDFIVDVRGDLTRPRLERPEHIESRWLAADDVDVLAENRGLDGGMIRDLVELALGYYSEPGRLARPHVTAFVDPAAATPVDALRARWDPAMAAQIPAHVTVAYPSEIGSLDCAHGRLAEVVAGVAPFRLMLGQMRCDEELGTWTFVDVDDVDGGWAVLRERLLGTSDATGARPHVTVVHPRTTNRGPAAWAALQGRRFDGAFTVTDVAVTAFDGRVWQTVERVTISS